MKNNEGFTLIELLIVIVIVGILSVISYFTWFQTVSQRTRDTQRAAADTGEIKTALEQFYEKKNKYPPLDEAYNTQTIFSSDTIPAGATDWIPELKPAYIAQLPTDPQQDPPGEGGGGGGGGGSSTPTFVKAIGGTASDSSGHIQKTSDNGYIEIGSTQSYGAGGWDILLAKFDSQWNLSWAKTYGGSGDDGATGVQTSDGGYAMAGSTNSYGGGGAYKDIIVVKVDSSGNVQWSKTWGGSTNNDFGNAIDQTADGGYMVGGMSASFTTGGFNALLKYDANGNLQWQKVNGVLYFGEVDALKATPDGGFIATGQSGGNGGDLFFAKYDSSGNLSWLKKLGGTRQEQGYNIKLTSDGGYVAAGLTKSYGRVGNQNMFVVKLDSGGNLQWTQVVYWPNAPYYGILRTIAETSDGFVAGGDGYNTGWLIKLNKTNGALIWSKKPPKIVNSITALSDDSVLFSSDVNLAGNNEMGLKKANKDGNITADGCTNETPDYTFYTTAPALTLNSATWGTELSPSATVTSPTLNTTTVNPTVTIVCQTQVSQPKSKYVYYSPVDRSSYQIWAILENENDPRIYTSPTAECKATPPPEIQGQGFNYCTY